MGGGECTEGKRCGIFPLEPVAERRPSDADRVAPVI